jgi:hypothetical protein
VERIAETVRPLAAKLRTNIMAMYDNLLANVPTDLWIGGQWRKSS